MYPGENTAQIFSHKISREKIKIIKSIDLLVIDEISMVRADLLDAIDAVLRRFRNKHEPFGGVQLLMIGDLHQMAPVVKEDDKDILNKYYDTFFFFGCRALQQTRFVTIELQHIYRQSDRAFIHLLNKIRDNQLDGSDLTALNSRYIPDFQSNGKEKYITLTTHNAQAHSINTVKLEQLPGKSRKFKAIIQDDFPEYVYPTPQELEFKKGAQVMFVKNDLSKDKLFFNGKIGEIIDFEERAIIVQCAGDDTPIWVEPAEWQNMKYTLNPETHEIVESVIGTFIQYPLKLAWAITIHKSQGLTFDRAIIDARAAFAYGQVYVALSRCRTLEGLVLSSPLRAQGIIHDAAVKAFVADSLRNPPDGKLLHDAKHAFQVSLIQEAFNFKNLHYRLLDLLKIVSEKKDLLLGAPHETVEKLLHQVRQDLVHIADNFQPQLQQLLTSDLYPEDNEALQERFRKACRYFLDRLTNLVSEMKNDLKYETDNRDIRKTLSESMEKIMLEARTKENCLLTGLDGFSTKVYLAARAKGSLDKGWVSKTSGKASSNTPINIKHPDLYRDLQEWRKQKAHKSGKPAYAILHSKTLASITALLPISSATLVQIKGMGKRKIASYGDELLEIVTNYCQQRQINSPGVA
jgi:hypothetical protein